MRCSLFRPRVGVLTPGLRTAVAETHETVVKSWCSLFVMGLLILVFLTGGALAQAQELFTAIPSNKLLDATPAQTQAIEKLRQRPTTQTLDLVQVDINALRGNTTRLSIPNTTTLTLSKRNEEIRSPSDFTWYGTLTGVPGQATLVVRDGNITGSIQDQDTLYRIEPVGNGVHALIKVDRGRFPPEHPPSFQQLERRGDIQAPITRQDTSRGDALIGIDVLVAYTTAARTAVTDINATIQLAVAEADQSYVNSGIRIKLTLVDSFEVAYSETGKTFDTILADFVANANVQSRRDQSGADLAAMIINKSDYCGLADAIMANASTAFAVVHYDCATGYYSFAHELGHLMGARHDEQDDPTTTPFAYGHGLRRDTAPNWRTVMAYNCPGGCARLQYWSNPNIQYNGVAMGTAATNDNARVLNETASTVAAFRNRGGAGSDQVMCFVFDDGHANMEGPSDAIFISGRTTNNEEGKACIPGGQFGHCHKWFGRCYTATNSIPVFFNVFDDGYVNMAGRSDAVYIPKDGNKACVPDQGPTGTCRRWFGRASSNDGRNVTCTVFDDGYANMAGPADAVYIPHAIPGPGSACIPDQGPSGTCRRWFGRCQAR